MSKFGPSKASIRRTMIAAVASLALGTATMAIGTMAFARGGGGGCGHFGGGDFGGGFGAGHFGDGFGPESRWSSLVVFAPGILLETTGKVARA
jgi:hypothetical protein